MHHVPMLLLSGFLVLTGFYAGQLVRKTSLPGIIGYMLLGLLLGPSFLGIIDHEVQQKLSFITEVALGFVALSIGLELSFTSLKKQGSGIITIIIAESFGAFLLTGFCVYLLTGDVALSLIFGSFAPASAPAGTVAVIKEYRAKGSLTKALYAVVGFDDGLAIIIFGFAAAVVRMLLLRETHAVSGGILFAFIKLLEEIILSIGIGAFTAFILTALTRKMTSRADLFILITGFILVTDGICAALHLSVILTNMVIGLVIVNTQRNDLTSKLGDVLSDVMPFLFILFFALAGANLHINSLAALGVLGVVYIMGRTAGLMGGAYLGGLTGKVHPHVRKYVGMGILSQAGVAIGLALVVKQDFQGMGRIVEVADGVVMHTGDIIGNAGITTITATCIFFEIIGPILTKVALKKAGEINT